MNDPLGFITWYSIPSEPVKLSALWKAWTDATLNPVSLPAGQRTVDLFRRALRAEESLEMEVEEVLQSDDEVVYQLTRVTRDAELKVVRYRNALRVAFNKRNGVIVYQTLDVADTPLAMAKSRIEAYMHSNAKTIGGDRVREIVRNYITSYAGMSGVNLRGNGGGVYFVLDRQNQKIVWLAKALDAIHPDHRAYLNSVPLADDEYGRQLVKRHHVASLTEDIKQAIAAADKILRGDRQIAVRSNVAGFHRQRLLELGGIIAQYDHLYDPGKETMMAMLAILKGKVDKIGGLT